MAAVELRFSADPANVRTARLLAATLARRAGVDESVVDEVKLAVGDACARAVGIHRLHAPGEQVVVTFSDDGPAYTVTVRDRGPAGADAALEVTEEVAALAGTGEHEPFGFGLAVVAGLVDGLVVAPARPGTEVTMAWPRVAAELPAT